VQRAGESRRGALGPAGLGSLQPVVQAHLRVAPGRIPAGIPDAKGAPIAVNLQYVRLPAPDPTVQDATWEGAGWIARPHIQNWLDCIKSRETPNADVEIKNRSFNP